MDFDLDLDLGNLTRALTGRGGGMPGPGSVLTSRDLMDAIDSEREGSGEDVISDDVRFKHFLAIFYDVFFFLKKKSFISGALEPHSGQRPRGCCSKREGR